MRARGAGAFLIVATAATPAVGRVEITPELGVRQVITFGENRDTNAYLEASAGFNAQIARQRVQGTVDYRFGQRFVQSGDLNQNQTHQLLGRIGAEVLEERLTVEVGGFAALLNRDLAGDVSFDPDFDTNNLVQTYSAYVAPRYSEQLGSFAELDVSYRFGVFEVDEEFSGSLGGGGGGGSRFAIPSDSINHTVTAQLGNRERSSRFRWDLIGTYVEDQASRLDQNYRNYGGRAELSWAITRGINLIGTIGYEDLLAREQDIVRDVNGLPVIGPDGDLVPDPSGARRTVYEQSGIIALGGVRLQPSRRSFIEVRAGERYGQFNIGGEARYQPTERLVFTARLREDIDTNGRVLTQDLSSLGRGIVSSVVGSRDLLGVGGCVFGTDPGTGGCLFSATQSLTSALFRNQSAELTGELNRGQTRAALSLIYNRRTFLDTQQIQRPGLPIDPELLGSKDETIGLNARISREFRNGGSASAGAFVNRFRFALVNDRDEYYAGLSANYRLNLDRNLRVDAGANVGKNFSDRGNAGIRATLSAGVAYRF